jgi:DNA (cytosine-5)-methyltransferase 1
MSSCLRTKSGKRCLRVAGLFAGVGGFELGLQRAGHHTVMLCEADHLAREILRKRFRGVPLRTDVRKVRYLPRQIDLVAAGFPCQDLSQAGTTCGLSGRQSRLVWETFRLIKKQKPPFVLFENVPFMLRLNRGREIRRILVRLERLGYKWAYRIVNAQAFGVPQRRPRVFILGSRTEDPRNILLVDDARALRRYSRGKVYGFYWTEGNTGIGLAVNAVPALKNGSGFGIPSAPAIAFDDGRIVTPHICDAERLQGFPPHWTAVADKRFKRKHRWRLVGNAVNVRVSTWIGCRLAQPGEYVERKDRKIVDGKWPTAAYNIGTGRFMADVGEFPLSRASRMSTFLRFAPKPLSMRATEGILARLLDSSLSAKSILGERLWLYLSELEQPTTIGRRKRNDRDST